jgi:hypothetical protein
MEPVEHHPLLRDLRIQVPEPVPHTPPTRPPARIPAAPIKVRPSLSEVDDKQDATVVDVDSDEDPDAEYIEAPPQFTWTDEHSKKSDEKAEWHQLIWNGLLAQFPFEKLFTQPLQPSVAPFNLFTFYESNYYVNKHMYPHHHIGDLMFLYMEIDGRLAYLIYMNKNRHSGKGGPLFSYEEYHRRHHLIERFFIPKKIVWNPAYYHAYCEWSESTKDRDPAFKCVNRFQRMALFMKTFFE